MQTGSTSEEEDAVTYNHLKKMVSYGSLLVSSEL